MIRLDLDPREAEVLCEVLDGYLADLRMEIADTDLLDYRQRLKARKEVIIKALAGLRHTPEAPFPE